ncbi:MAG: bacillithiol biosynthesis cysteine-adding enzyme BshC [bacterium]
MKFSMSQMPGVSALVKDFFDNFEKVSEFYNGNYRNLSTFLERTDGIKSKQRPLGQLVPILKEQNQCFGCGTLTLEKIDLLLEGRACAVVTGQQTGLFGGPLFTVYKALTAIKLAERLSRNCDGCFVPIFWLASDDHDFREVNHIHFIDKNNQPIRLSYDGHPVDSKLPVSRIQIAPEIAEIIEQIDQATHPSEFKENVLQHLSQAYRAGAAFSQAFGVWLTHLFKSFGLIFMDASDARIKKLGQPVFHKEIAERSPSTEQGLKANARLQVKDYHIQVQLHEGILNLFFAEKERHALELQNNKFIVKGGDLAFDKAQLLELVQEKPQHFSPNVLLRPILQDMLLPTVAYVAGPAESAYYAQMKGIYEAFGLTMPIIYPRKSITLLESKIEKVLDNYQLQVSDFWGKVDSLITEIVKAQLPESLEQSIAETSASVDEKLQALTEQVLKFEPTLENTVDQTRGRILNQIEGLEKKILQAYKKRNDVITQQIYKAKNSLYPNNLVQERELNILPYLFKFGFDFIDQLYEAMDISHFDHQIIRL